MRKVFILLLILFSANCAFSEDKININEYLNKSYIGMTYNEAINQDIPFLLVFANPNDLISIVKLAGVGQMVYKDFKGQYNFCILNTKEKENKNLLNFFNPEYLPALYIINTQTRHYIFVNKKFYNKKSIKEILTDNINITN